MNKYLVDFLNFTNNNFEAMVFSLSFLVSLVAGIVLIYARRRIYQSIEHDEKKINRYLKASKNRANFDNKTTPSVNQKVINEESTFSNNENSENNTVEELIKKHHKQALQQAAIHFWVSIITSIAGFIFIMIMIIASNGQDWYRYILNLLPGAIIEVVSVLFINQSNALRERSADFLNRLRIDRQIDKSIEIVETIDNEKLKFKVKAKIALHMNGIDDSVLSSDD